MLALQPPRGTLPPLLSSIDPTTSAIDASRLGSIFGSSWRLRQYRPSSPNLARRTRARPEAESRQWRVSCRVSCASFAQAGQSYDSYLWLQSRSFTRLTTRRPPAWRAAPSPYQSTPSSSKITPRLASSSCAPASAPSSPLLPNLSPSLARITPSTPTTTPSMRRLWLARACSLGRLPRRPPRLLLPPTSPGLR